MPTTKEQRLVVRPELRRVTATAAFRLLAIPT
jgi:hypothetical protein